MAAPTFVDAAATDVNGAPGTSAAISFTSTFALDVVGEATDDYAIAALYKESTSAVTAPSGWTLLGQADQDTGGFKYRAYVYGRRIDGSETTATWSWSGSTWRYLECAVYSNAITTEDPVITFVSEEETAQNTTPTHAGITIQRSNSGLVWIVFNFSDVGNTTAPTGFTHRVPWPGSSLDRNILIYDDLTVSPGASGTVSVTLGGDIEWPLTVLLELATEAGAPAVTAVGASMQTLPLEAFDERLAIDYTWLQSTPLTLIEAAPGDITGTASVVIGAPTIASSGTVTVSGTAAAAISGPSLSAAGSLAFTASGALAIAAPSIAASGSLVFSSSGALLIARPSLAASGTLAYSASGAVLIGAPSIAASGASGDVIAGAASLLIGAPALAAAGLETIAGTGALLIARPALAASGALLFSSTGALLIGAPSLAAFGVTGDVIAGSATLIIQKPALAGSGTAQATFSGAATVLIGPPSLAGAALVRFAGAAAILVGPPGLAASGLLLVAVAGTGAIIIGAPLIEGSEIPQGPGTVHGGVELIGAAAGGLELIGGVRGGGEIVGGVRGGVKQRG